MVWIPVPEMLKSIVSAPPLPFAEVMAFRRLPAPASFVFVTVKVAPVKLMGKKIREKQSMKDTTKLKILFFFTVHPLFDSIGHEKLNVNIKIDDVVMRRIVGESCKNSGREQYDSPRLSVDRS